MEGRCGLDSTGPEQKQVAGCCDIQYGANFSLLHGETKSVPQNYTASNGTNHWRRISHNEYGRNSRRLVSSNVPELAYLLHGAESFFRS
jgi:hypothetical protein